MKRIPLTKGKLALVDDADYERLSQHKWYYHNVGYAVRSTYDKKTGKKGKVYMHREMLNPPKGFLPDHIDGDPLNNQRGNLRLVTVAQNQWNQKRPVTNKSGYKGVHWSKRFNSWCASITFANKVIYLGSFKLVEEGALAYNQAAIKYFGEFARLNNVRL